MMCTLVYLVLNFTFIWSCSSSELLDITDNEQFMNIPAIKSLVNRMNDLETREALHIKALEKLRRETQLETEGLRKELAMQRDHLKFLHKKISHQSRLLTEFVRRDQLRSKSPAKEHGSVASASVSVSPDEEQETHDENTVKRIRRAENADSVAFTAGITLPFFHAGPHQNILFDHVETNIGNGYNPHHGVFIAPVSGLYLFYSSILSGHGGEVYCQIVVNGVSKATIYARGTDDRHDQGSQVIIVNLQRGDDVAVQNYHADDIVYSDGDIYSTFSGVLLQQSFLQSGTVIG